jgi:glutamate racemase
MQPSVVGVFDSGVGGLSVWREIDALLPHADLLYVADQAHCPYGPRSTKEIRSLAKEITAFLIHQGADVVVVACNTASAAALRHLRDRFPVPIVGMEPAVKPAVEHTHTGHVGVIATPVTFQGMLFASLLERQVEAGLLEGPETMALLHDYIDPLVEQGIDTLVLGCTHYPFLRQSIARIVGPDVEIIDPAPAVARQTARVLARACPDAPRARQGRRTLYTTGDVAQFRQQVERLVGKGQDVKHCHPRGRGDPGDKT